MSILKKDVSYSQIKKLGYSDLDIRLAINGARLFEKNCKYFKLTRLSQIFTSFIKTDAFIKYFMDHQND